MVVFFRRQKFFEKVAKKGLTYGYTYIILMVTQK